MSFGYIKIFRNYEAIKNIVASQTENITRNKDWMVISHGLLDGAKLLWRAMIWAYRICGKNSTH
jgi:hypothetical protein